LDIWIIDSKRFHLSVSRPEMAVLSDPICVAADIEWAGAWSLFRPLLFEIGMVEQGSLGKLGLV